MDAKKLLHTLDYVPRWVWYVVSLCAAGPLGALGVYIVFHVLGRMAGEQPGNAHTDSAGQTERYEDAECVVTSEEETEKERMRAQAAQRRARAENAQKAPLFSENADVSEVLRGGYDAIRRIREANDIIADEELSLQIDSIENSCRQILSLLEEREQLLPQLRTFLRYYLPAALRLLDARAQLEHNASTRKAREVRARISEALGVIDKAFLKQMEALDEYRFIDLESEMDVLRDMLRQDGLIDEEEKDDPFSQALGGK